MGIYPEDLLRLVIHPSLDLCPLSWRGKAAERLLLLTAVHESGCGRYLAQVHGPARGIYQMELAGYSEALDRLKRSVAECANIHAPGWPARPEHNALAWDLRLATLCARAYYAAYAQPLPDSDDIDGLAHYWHAAWCRGCKGQPETAIEEWVQATKGLSV